MAAPIPYDPSMDPELPDEAETSRSINETMQKIRETTLRDEGKPIRSVHAKAHGLLEGTLEVLPGLAPELAQGLGSRPGTYPVILRLSTIPGDILDDSVSTPRGVSMKILQVEGERLPGSEGDRTQDFILVNGPTFNAPNAKVFSKNLKLLAATTDKAEGAKKAISATMRGVETIIETFGAKPSALITALGGQRETHILGDTFYSQLPVLWGRYFGKVSLVPVSAELKALEKAKLNVNGKPNGLREAVSEFFTGTDAVWELRVQLCTNLETMPIEDANKEWSEEESPYLTVARVTVPAQSSWTDDKARLLDDGLSFSPWHGLAAHRPLGSLMRMRKSAYKQGADFRSAHNGMPLSEPTALPV